MPFTTNPAVWRDFLAQRAADETARALATSAATRRRRTIVCLVTLVVAGVALRWSLGIAPGDPLFYPATLALAMVLFAGAFAAGPALRPTVGEQPGRTSDHVRIGLSVGAALLVLFLFGAVLVAQIPPLRDPVQELLDHAAYGALPVVLILTVLNGIAEEFFYRGALFDASAGRRPVVVTTLVYTLVTALAGIPLLALAALLVGLACALLRRWTRGLAAPIICHLIWSVGMLLLLDPALSLLETT